MGRTTDNTIDALLVLLVAYAPVAVGISVIMMAPVGTADVARQYLTVAAFVVGAYVLVVVGDSLFG